MSTIQINRNWQPEPVSILVESRPVKEGVKLSNKASLEHNPGITWKDLMGFSYVMDSEETI